jgi:hypothetical protein
MPWVLRNKSRRACRLLLGLQLSKRPRPRPFGQRCIRWAPHVHRREFNRLFVGKRQPQKSHCARRWM